MLFFKIQNKYNVQEFDWVGQLVGLIVIIIIKDELGSYHQIFFENGIKHNSKDVEIIRIGKESSTNSKISSF